MVCKKCETKLGVLATPDVWKQGARVGSTVEGRDRTGRNMLLAVNAGQKGLKVTSKINPYAIGCKICKNPVHHKGGRYCQYCSYKKGLCSMCGIKIMDTTMYRQSIV